MFFVLNTTQVSLKQAKKSKLYNYILNNKLKDKKYALKKL